MKHLDSNPMRHHDVSMRTTLTLEDDLAEQLKRRARTTGRSFKEVVNEAIRRGLSLGESPADDPPPFRIEARKRGFRGGLDPTKLNQLYDELEAEERGRRSAGRTRQTDDTGEPEA